MTLPVSGFPVTAGADVVGLGTVLATVGFGEPCRWPGEVGADGEAFADALGGVRVGVGLGVGLAVGDGPSPAARLDSAAETMAWVDSALAGPVGSLLAAGAGEELTETAGAGDDDSLSSVWEAALLDGEHAATAARAAIAMTTWVRLAVPVRRAIPHAATAGRWTGDVIAHA
jgi:hypothetical protein